MQATHFDNGPLRTVPFRCIMIGATGATGKLVVEKLLKLENLEKLTLLVRKSGKAYEDKRIQVLEVNFDKLGFEFEQKKELLGQFDVMISCLGTTKGAAGSAEAYRKIEVDYPRDFARMARVQCGVKVRVCVFFFFFFLKNFSCFLFSMRF